MKRPIKFRGRDSFTGEFHYGFYFADEDGVQVFENRHSYLVDPESVAQLVGYDCDGREVYEGDVCLYPDGSEFTAAIFSHPETIKSCWLKEAQT